MQDIADSCFDVALNNTLFCKLSCHSDLVRHEGDDGADGDRPGEGHGDEEEREGHVERGREVGGLEDSKDTV